MTLQELQDWLDRRIYSQHPSTDFCLTIKDKAGKYHEIVDLKLNQRDGIIELYTDKGKS